MMGKTKNIWRGAALVLLVGAGGGHASLLAHFSFDSDVDSVAGSYAGTGGLRDDAHIDTTTFKEGGGALALDGGYGPGEANLNAEVDGVYYSNDAELDPGTGSYTITAWVNHIDRANPVRQSLVNGGGSDSQLYMNNNKWAYWVRDGATSTTASGPWTPPPGTWKHIAVTLDQAANQIKFYENGALYSTTALDANILDIGTGEFYIGYQLVSDGSHRGFNGYIDEVGLWDEALDATAINDIYVNGIPEPATLGLVGIWAGILLAVRRARM